MERVILALFVVGSTMWMYSLFGTPIYRAIKTGSILGRMGSSKELPSRSSSIA